MGEQDIDKLIQQDEAVFQDLVEGYQSRFLSMAYKYTNNYTDAEDLCQEIFIKVYRALPTFKKNSHLSTWLYKIAVNRCLDWKRRQKPSWLQMIHVNDKTSKVLSDESAEDKVLYKEKQLYVHEAVYGLKDKYKVVVILYHFNELSYKEISDILQIPVKTIETRLYRARKQIKDQLMHQGYGGEIIEIQGI